MAWVIDVIVTVKIIKSRKSVRMVPKIKNQKKYHNRD